MVVIEIQKDEKKEQLIDSIMEHFKELQDEAGQLRREGKDTTTIDLMMMDVIPKSRFARVTYDEKDIDSLKRALGQIRHELDLIKSGTEFDVVIRKIQQAYDFIREGKLEDAEQAYKELRETYKSLSGELKNIVYKASLDIHKKLTQNAG
ncbi:hypothetical protein KY363_03500 [Candidatus Woesearchaeota archaeon]|nr:hypothetical protein [Candidatus Woesearchaeota archaeon]